MPPSVAFLHPDLGIGGAERLIVDCALALKENNYSVTIFTSHHDLNHCFVETKNGKLKIIKAGDWIPRSIFGHMRAFWAYFRMIYLTIFFILNYRFDLVICDQISSGVPLLKWFNHKCLFYCHFPDQLLTERKTILKKLYRFPIDWFEEWSTGYSDAILVNSHFTERIFHQTFKTLSNVRTKVLYPTVNFSALNKKITDNQIDIKLKDINTLFLSINRYERKKNLKLAIEALKVLYDSFIEDDKRKNQIHLIMAGGYDLQNLENLQHFEELINFVSILKLEKNVTFLKNLTDEQKQHLLHSCTAVLYTPKDEHFGIVPLEAMYMKRPVIAVDSGGPCETILHEETGYLCKPNAQSFADAMHQFVQDKSLSREMGELGHRRVVEKFSYQNFQKKLNTIVSDLIHKHP